MNVPAEPALQDLIREQIGRQGPLTFARFMELALYHERWGYYRRGRDPFGVAGDYFTSSQLQPVFGRLLAQQISRWREQMGRPEGFTVVELGPGRGETSAALSDQLRDVRCVEVEYGSGDRLQRKFTGVVFSNEFFDALPVHSVERRGDGFVEHYVEAAADRFRFVDGPPSDPRLEAYLEKYTPGLAEGQRIEVNLAALDQLETIAASLDRGYVLTIDYGYTAEEIAGGRRFPRGSLMSYHKHQAFEDVLAGAGSRDITAHVNFTALERRGAELGLASAGLRNQAQFLMDAGEPDQFAAALEAGNEQESLRLRLQLKTLLFGLGETFQVLVQIKT
jgi:SAM-dependent MidA family methyltransferase